MVNLTRNELEFIVTILLLRNGAPFKITNRSQRLLVCRLANRVNSKIPLGAIKVNPLLGTIFYTVVVKVTPGHSEQQNV